MWKCVNNSVAKLPAQGLCVSTGLNWHSVKGCTRKRALHLLFYQVSRAMYAGDKFKVLIKMNEGRKVKNLICNQWQICLYVSPPLFFYICNCGHIGT